MWGRLVLVIAMAGAIGCANPSNESLETSRVEAVGPTDVVFDGAGGQLWVRYFREDGSPIAGAAIDWISWGPTYGSVNPSERPTTADGAVDCRIRPTGFPVHFLLEAAGPAGASQVFAITIDPDDSALAVSFLVPPDFDYDGPPHLVIGIYEPHSCDAPEPETGPVSTTRRIDFREERPERFFRLESLPGTYTVRAVLDEGRRSERSACRENVEIEQGNTTHITLRLR